MNCTFVTCFVSKKITIMNDNEHLFQSGITQNVLNSNNQPTKELDACNSVQQDVAVKLLLHV